ncbi:hypothetical protein SAMN02745164_01699 [Marinitoga hydrogenitolerans DSM 16785]|uniref:PD-(D/E)XK nuclease superfamily protein n=1 Tax=Marinitoga hydrogenitolerans (strain DSM 16785 / JCM 12826 / AT1271) TaxID=1122195 RepID=A0A1M4YJT9_MARH1|nr:hypothetical protein [Marinitoga hydrogenitolerans]SHF05923.1 hypothetical protein SAMN02745164_01699 [Marinitoga hydrogenitolerans DSM 16785]
MGYLRGILEDNASPFNIAEHLEVPYFTKEQVYDLLNQHEKETGQIFDEKVKELMMKILFELESVEFDISDDRIKFLYLNEVIDDCDGKCCVKVSLYYKKLYNHFKPEINAEKTYMATIKDTTKPYLKEDGTLDLNKLMKRYRGRVDLLINIHNKEYLIEVKANITGNDYEKSKKQIKEYIKRKGLKEGWLIIYSDTIKDFEYIIEEENGIKLHIWFIKTNFESPSIMK